MQKNDSRKKVEKNRKLAIYNGGSTTGVVAYFILFSNAILGIVLRIQITYFKFVRLGEASCHERRVGLVRLARKGKVIHVIIYDITPIATYN